MKSTLLFFFLLLNHLVFAQTFYEDRDAALRKVAASQLGLADIDGDGDLDLLITGEVDDADPFRVSILYTNDGLGNFTQVSDTTFEQINFGSVAFADVDGDNDLDVMLSGYPSDAPYVFGFTMLYINDGAGNFSEVANNPFRQFNEGEVAFGDIDGDNDQDVIITGRSLGSLEGAKLYTNDGQGNFTEVEDTPFLLLLDSSVNFFDNDGDNDLDLIMAGVVFDTASGSGRIITTLYSNDGTGNFSEVINTPFEGIHRGSIDVDDIDGDGDQDVLISGEGIDDTFRKTIITKLYTNDGTGNFLAVDDAPFLGVFTGFAAFNDVDNDNDPDVLVSGGTSFISNFPDDGITRLYINDGLGNYSVADRNYYEGFTYSNLAIGDIDGDNDLDFVLTGGGVDRFADTKLYINIGRTISVKEVEGRTDLEITTYPNPTKAKTLKLDYTSSKSGIITLKVFDVTGTLLYQSKESVTLGQQTIEVDITSLTSGSYQLHVSNGNSEGVTKFIVH